MTSASARPLSSRLVSIDCLRGGAALAVVFYHTTGRDDSVFGPHVLLRSLFQLMHQGYLGVPLFFVISGFCIHLRWAKAQAEAGQVTAAAEVSFLDFWKRRLHRLYPPYLVALCLTMGAMWIVYRRGGSLPEYPQPQGYWIRLDFLTHLAMLHGLCAPFDYTGGNSVYWTLAREEYFYLMYFALLWWRRARGVAVTLLTVFLAGVIVPPVAKVLCQRLAHDAVWWRWAWYPFNDDTSAIALWIQWALGMAAVEDYYGLITLPRWCRWGSMTPVWVAAAYISGVYELRWLTPLLWGLAFFTLLNYCVALERAGRWPDRAVVRWLARTGLFSYSLYLIHKPVIETLFKLESVGRHRGGAGMSSPAYYIGASLAMAGLAYGAGYLFFLLVERHFLTARRPRQNVALQVQAT